MDAVDWPIAFVIMGGLTATLALLWFVFAKDGPDQSISSPNTVTPAQAISTPPQIRSIFFLTLSYAAVGYFQYLFFYWLHYYFESVLHMNTDDSRWYAGLPN